METASVVEGCGEPANVSVGSKPEKLNESKCFPLFSQ